MFTRASRRGPEVLGQQAEGRAVRRHRQVDGECRELSDQHGKVGPDRRLASVRRMLSNAEPFHADTERPVDLLEGRSGLRGSH